MENSKPISRKPLFYGLLAVALALFFPAAQAMAALAINNLEIVQTTRVGRTTFEYQIQGDVTNDADTTFSTVTANVMSPDIGVVVLDPTLSFGIVGPGATVTSTDTFKIRVDRRFAFDPNNLMFDITGTEVDATAPVIEISNPAANAELSDNSPTILVSYSDADSGVNTASLAFQVNGNPADANCNALPTSAECSLTDALPEGAITLQASIADNAGNVDTDEVSFTVVSGTPTDEIAPVLSILRPSADLLVVANPPRVEVEVTDDDSGVDFDSLTISTQVAGGSPVLVPSDCSVNGSRVECILASPIPEGDSTLLVTADDNAGNSGSDTVDISVDSLPVVVNIASPTQGFITQDGQITVVGSVSDGVTSVTVDGVAATLVGVDFSVNVPLREGLNMLVAVVQNVNGKTGSRTVDVWRDNIAPTVRIDSPIDNFVAFENRIAITGTVNDIVNGGTAARVFVNEFEATVTDNSFMVTDLALLPGSNRFTAIAIDAAGNQSDDVIHVEFQEIVGARLNVFSGNGQAGEVDSQLPQPLEVLVRDDLNNPVAGRIVSFQVVRSSGLLEPEGGGVAMRTLQIPTDGNGKARVLFKLGETTGEGNNRVSVVGQGVPGSVEFCASAVPSPADKILMQMGDNQRGLVGNPLDAPFEALVVDIEGNPVVGAEVTFTVTRGNGSIDGATQVVRLTNVDGVARAILLLDQEPGINNNIVAATTPGVLGLPASFVASGLAQGDPENTRFSGVVLDNTQTPIPGALITIEGAPDTALTDEEGHFTVLNVPIGKIHLRIDPTNSPRPETFPPLEFETIAVLGQNNILGQPIQIPAIDVGAAEIVGGNEDVVIRMPGVDGLSLTVFANSATFGDGSKIGPVSISQVHLDKVPMPPPSGTFFMPPAWTIQPAGTQFDPPAKITIPNDGLPPGRVINIFQFDHSLNEFIDVGTGTVTEDASIIVSDPGFGITRAGWGGCGQPPPPDTCADACSDGDVCNGQESCEDGACVAGPPPPPETPVDPQTSGNCQTETCGGSEPNDGDTPEDTDGDCQSPTCMDGSPGSENNDADTPENVPGDCQAPTCMDGAPGSEDDNSDIPEDTSGDCQAPTCMDGAPGSENDDLDVPEDTSGDCQAPTCMDGAPGSEDDNADIPEDTVGDCQAPACMDGAPASMPDDADIGEDTAGDCRAPACMDGTPGDVDDDADVPEDTPGDCRAAVCMNGAPDTEPDDNDTPEDLCKECTDGDITDVDVSSFFDDASVAAEVIMPQNIKDKVDSVLNRIPGLGGVQVNEIKAGLKGQSRDCCNPQDGVIENGVKEGSGIGSLRFEINDIQLWPLPPTSIFKSWLVEGFGVIAVIEVDFQAGVFLDTGFEFSGAIGLRRNQCEGEDCFFGEAKAAVIAALRVTVEAIACLEVDTVLGDRRDCLGFGVTPAQLNFSVNGSFTFNKNACGEGPGGSVFVGSITFQASFSPGLPGVGTLTLEIPILPGFQVI